MWRIKVLFCISLMFLCTNKFNRCFSIRKSNDSHLFCTKKMRIITLSYRKGYKLLLFVSSISHNDPNAVQSPVLGARHCFSSRYRHLLHFLNLCTTAPLFQLKFSRHRISTTAPHFGEKKISAIFEPYFSKKSRP